MIDQERVNRIKARGNVPRHVAVIMDGNGRWAKGRGLPRTEGHKEGIESVRAAVEAAGALGIKALTLYTFSSENWARPRSEVAALMSLLVRTVRREAADLDRNNVRLTVIGDLEQLPPTPRMGFKATIARLQKNTGLILNLALSYSGRQEIVLAARNIARRPPPDGSTPTPSMKPASPAIFRPPPSAIPISSSAPAARCA